MSDIPGVYGLSPSIETPEPPEPATVEAHAPERYFKLSFLQPDRPVLIVGSGSQNVIHLAMSRAELRQLVLEALPELI